MASSPALLSMEHYLNTSYRPDVDFVEGHVEERCLGEFEHATLQSAINGWFWPRRKDWGILPVTEQRIRVAEDRIRICDVALLRSDAPREKVTVTPPLVCLEILSRKIVSPAQSWSWPITWRWVSSISG